MKYEGIWHIIQMDMWDEDYFNMEVQAFIRVRSNNLGSFQFGLVSGDLDGEVVRIAIQNGLNSPGKEMMRMIRHRVAVG